MKMTEFFLAQLEREAGGTRRAVERVPDGRDDWKPHEKSMPLGYLATLVATMPGWLAMMIERDDLDLNPPGGGSRLEPPRTSRERVEAFDKSVAEAREAARGTGAGDLRTVG